MRRLHRILTNRQSLRKQAIEQRALAPRAHRYARLPRLWPSPELRAPSNRSRPIAPAPARSPALPPPGTSAPLRRSSAALPDRARKVERAAIARRRCRRPPARETSSLRRRSGRPETRARRASDDDWRLAENVLDRTERTLNESPSCDTRVAAEAARQMPSSNQGMLVRSTALHRNPRIIRPGCFSSAPRGAESRQEPVTPLKNARHRLFARRTTLRQEPAVRAKCAPPAPF